MIYLNLQITNPWYKDSWSWKTRDYINNTWKLTRNKFLEIQLSRFGMDRIAAVAIDLRWRGYDHAGPGIQLDLLGFMFEIKLSDQRHWDHRNGKWEEYTNE